MNRLYCLLIGVALLPACAQVVRPDSGADTRASAIVAPPADGTVAVDLSIARLDAPSAVRVHLLPEDQPRSVQLGPRDVLCLSLHRRGEEVVLRIGAKAPQVQPATELVIAGPGVEPGTYRTTSWHVLARLPTTKDSITGDRAPLAAATFPQCRASAALPAAHGRNAGPSGA